MRSITIYCSQLGEVPYYTQSLHQNQGCHEDDSIHENEQQSSGTKTVELHINIWKVKSGTIRLNDTLYFDFGIKFSDKIKRIFVFLPFQIKANKVNDLGKVVSDKKELLNAVFNDDMRCTPSPNNSFSKVEINNNQSKSSFYIYQLGQDNITVEDYKGETDDQKGTYISIKINGTPQDENGEKEYYIRFRVEVKNNKEIIHTAHLSNDLLQAAFSKTDLYDLRINEKREVPAKVNEKAETNGFTLCDFRKLHLFYIVDAHETVNNGSTVKIDTRILEDNQWKDYEPKSDINGINYIAYHWKKKAKEANNNQIVPFNNFSLFFDTIYPKLSFVRLTAYLCVVILFGWFGSMLTFKLNELIPFTLKGWIRPFIVIGISIFVLIFIFVCNYSCKGIEVKRKI